MKKNQFRKTLVLAIVIIFVGVCVTPGIFGRSFKRDSIKVNLESDILELSSCTFFTFDKIGSKECNVELEVEVAEDIAGMLEVLKYKIVYEPFSEETRILKSDFVDLLENNGLLPVGMSRDKVLSLLNPSWLSWFEKEPYLKTGRAFKTGFINILNLLGSLQRFFVSQEVIDFFNSFSGSGSASAILFFCSMASGGHGIPIPLFLLPRPRGFVLWSGSDECGTNANSLLSKRVFIAGGTQNGFALGFIGVGLTYSLFGETLYAFIGYSTFTFVNAKSIQWYTPPNEAPKISDENPVNGAIDVPLTLNELSFRISDADRDRMSYKVTTSPNIGSGSGSRKKNGVYKVPVSGLEPYKGYSWTVEVSDAKDTTMKQFSFYTEMLPFDPFDEGWLYRKKITIDHDLVKGDLSDFPVLVSVVDDNLHDKAQSDGDDILFMDGSGVANRLFHEIELFDGSSGELAAWVRIPSLDKDVDTIFYIYYGNPSCDNQQYPEKVWDSNFIHVWHMNGSGDVYPSAGSDIGTNYGTDSVSGKIGDARDIIASNSDYIDFGDMTQPGDGSLKTATAEYWLSGINTLNGAVILSKYDTSTAAYWNGLVEGHRPRFNVYDDSHCLLFTADNQEIYNDTWQHLAYIVDLNTQNIDIYVNGSEVASTKTTTGQTDYFRNAGATDRVSKYVSGSGSQYYDCIIDELRWSKIVRSSAWISTSYNTMNDPSSFMSFGPEELGP